MIPSPDEACSYCDRGWKYKPDSDQPWAKELAPLGIGHCCATTIIREEFKNDGVSVVAVARFGLTGSFWNYAKQVFDAGPQSAIGQWFLTTYLEELR